MLKKKAPNYPQNLAKTRLKFKKLHRYYIIFTKKNLKKLRFKSVFFLLYAVFKSLKKAIFIFC